jgi:hypothetical protein
MASMLSNRKPTSGLDKRRGALCRLGETPLMLRLHRPEYRVAKRNPVLENVVISMAGLGDALREWPSTERKVPT